MMWKKAYQKYKSDGIYSLFLAGNKYIFNKYSNLLMHLVFRQTILKPKLYNISPNVGEDIEFDIFLPYGKRSDNSFDTLGYHQTSYLEGSYESEVLSTIIDEVDENTVFWQVGARFGYFSLAIADRVKQVLAIEPLEKNVEYISKSIVANNYNNFNVTQEYINNETTLDDIESNYSRPDVIVMDIEGWELMALQNAKNLLSTEPTWIIEVHRSPQPGVHPPNFSPDNENEIRDILENHGYNLNVIGSDNGKGNYHIIAKK